MPAELRTTSLKKCLEKIIDYRGKTPKKLGSDWVENGYRALSANNVKDSGLVSAESIRCVDAETYKKWMREEVRRGDLLLTSEAPAGEVMLWDSDEKIVLSQRLFALRANDKFDNRFIKYYLQSPTGKREVKRTRSGSTVEGISAEMFDQIQVVHPATKSAQGAIADVLSSLDAKIDLNKRINAELEALAKAIYDYWFVQFEFPNAKGKPYKSSGGAMVWNDVLRRDIPEGWKAVPISDLVSEVKEGVASKDIDPTTPYVGLEHIPRKSIVLPEWGRADEVTSNKIAFKRSDILFGKIRPYFHKVALAMMDGVASTDAIVLRPKRQEFAGLALETIFSEHFVKSATVSKTGSKMPRADWKVMRNFRVPVPMQGGAVCHSFQAMFADISNKIGGLVRENHELANLRDWLLPLLMNGQVRVA